MLTYAATIPLSTRSLAYLSGLLAEHRRQIGSRWRRLNPNEQALLVLAHVRNGDTYTRLAAGFRVGVATVYRYVREASAAVQLRAAGVAPRLLATRAIANRSLEELARLSSDPMGDVDAGRYDRLAALEFEALGLRH